MHKKLSSCFFDEKALLMKESERIEGTLRYLNCGSGKERCLSRGLRQLETTADSGNSICQHQRSLSSTPALLGHSSVVEIALDIS